MIPLTQNIKHYNKGIKTLRYSSNINNIEMLSESEEELPYLEKLDKQNKKKIERLKSIRDNITKYMDEKKPANSTNTTQISPKSRYNQNPIMQIDFDKLFLNMNQISQIFISSDYDRAVFYFLDGRRYIYYVKTTDDKELIEKIIRFISHSIKIKIICDKTLFTDKFGYLYH